GGDAGGARLRRLPEPRDPRGRPAARVAARRPHEARRRRRPRGAHALEAELKPRVAGRLFVSKSLPHFLEFAHPDVSKGSGLAFVADRLGFRPEETVACGDGENDRELLDWAGFGVAVANAHEDVLARADLVIPSVHEEGMADLLEAYLDSVR